jgi:hypothetical protein
MRQNNVKEQKRIQGEWRWKNALDDNMKTMEFFKHIVKLEQPY